jgi:hypothetical protein
VNSPPSNPVLTFVIPLRHPANASDWSAIKRRLTQTVQSIAAQDSERWQAIIVANAGADLPPLPRNFRVKSVDFPPNPMFERGENELEAFREACRLDKGRRVLAGVQEAGAGGYIMMVDDDDFVSLRLTSFVAAHQGANGWYVDKGYLWGDGGAFVYEYPDFSSFCGSSHIIRADLYQTPANSSEEALIRKLYGSHVFIREHLAERGKPLAPLPFLGAVYRIGHAGAHSKSTGLFRQVFFKRDLLRNPFKIFGRLARMHVLSARLRRQFWGQPLSNSL